MKNVSLTALFMVTLLATATTALPETAKGQGVYMNFCASCHASGIAGAPISGDRAAWQQRLAKGQPAIISNAIKGYQGNSGFMPAKGGNSALTDEEVTAAVLYMLEQSR